MNKKLCILLLYFFMVLPFFSDSTTDMYSLSVINYTTKNMVKLSTPEKEIVKRYIEELDSKKEIRIFKMPIDYLIILKYKEVSFKYRFSGDYLVNEDNYGIIIDDKFKKLLENLGI